MLRSLIPLVLYVPLTGACADGKLTQVESENLRSFPQQFKSGSFVIQLASTDDRSSSLDDLKRLAQESAESFGCDTEGPQEIAWADQSGAVSSDLRNTLHLELSNCALDEQATQGIMTNFSNSASVKSIEPEAVMSTHQMENDPNKSSQYYLDAINRDQSCEAIEDSNAPPIVVAIVDSGVDDNHPDLVDNLYRDRQGRVVGANFVGKGSRGSPDSRWGDNGNSHGTHVAGLVAATANNGRGIAGVGSCANVKIMPIRVMGSNGQGSSIEIDRGIQWAADRGAHVINLSLGSNSYSRSPLSSAPNTLYENLARRNIVVFAAAGNDGFVNGSRTSQGYLYSFPASYDHVIAVAATNPRGSLTRFSVKGSRIDIATPGESILSTVPGGRYQSMNGTSMATPIAAGAYALALSSIIEKVPSLLHHDAAIKALTQATNDQYPLDRQRVAVGGALDAFKLTRVLQEEFNSTPDMPPVSQDPEPAPKPIADTDPEEDQDEPDAPAMPEEGMRFVGLTAGQELSGPQRIAVTDWPDRTYAIYLYWATPGERASSFTSLGRESLNRNGDAVYSLSKYYLYGDQILMAEAVDFWGRRLKVISLPLQGL